MTHYLNAKGHTFIKHCVFVWFRLATSHVYVHQSQVSIPDIERNGHCFTDGVGQISGQLLRQALLKVPFALGPNFEQISAVQVRGGD